MCSRREALSAHVSAGDCDPLPRAEARRDGSAVRLGDGTEARAVGSDDGGQTVAPAPVEQQTELLHRPRSRLLGAEIVEHQQRLVGDVIDVELGSLAPFLVVETRADFREKVRREDELRGAICSE